MAHKYKAGDTVRVRTGLKRLTDYYMEDSSSSNTVTEGMKKWEGKVVTIQGYRYDQYSIEEDGGR